MMKPTLEEYEKIAKHIFKDETVRDGVRDVIFNDKSFYQAERDNGTKINTLTRHVRKYKAEIAYLESLGLCNQ